MQLSSGACTLSSGACTGSQDTSEAAQDMSEPADGLMALAALPELAGSPACQLSPHLPGTAWLPNLAGSPACQQSPHLPGTASLPNLAGSPACQQSPHLPGTASLPYLAGSPACQQSPHLPGTAVLPNLAGSPACQQSPHLPGTASLPNLAGSPACQQSPHLPGTAYSSPMHGADSEPADQADGAGGTASLARGDAMAGVPSTVPDDAAGSPANDCAPGASSCQGMLQDASNAAVPEVILTLHATATCVEGQPTDHGVLGEGGEQAPAGAPQHADPEPSDVSMAAVNAEQQHELLADGGNKDTQAQEPVPRTSRGTYAPAAAHETAPHDVSAAAAHVVTAAVKQAGAAASAGRAAPGEEAAAAATAATAGAQSSGAQAEAPQADVDMLPASAEEALHADDPCPEPMQLDAATVPKPTHAPAAKSPWAGGSPQVLLHAGQGIQGAVMRTPVHMHTPKAYPAQHTGGLASADKPAAESLPEPGRATLKPNAVVSSRPAGGWFGSGAFKSAAAQPASAATSRPSSRPAPLRQQGTPAAACAAHLRSGTASPALRTPAQASLGARLGAAPVPAMARQSGTPGSMPPPAKRAAAHSMGGGGSRLARSTMAPPALPAAKPQTHMGPPSADRLGKLPAAAASTAPPGGRPQGSMPPPPTRERASEQGYAAGPAATTRSESAGSQATVLRSSGVAPDINGGGCPASLATSHARDLVSCNKRLQEVHPSSPALCMPAPFIRSACTLHVCAYVP